MKALLDNMDYPYSFQEAEDEDTEDFKLPESYSKALRLESFLDEFKSLCKNPDDWRRMEPFKSRSAKFCGKSRNLLFHEYTRELGDFPKLCKQWDCEDCGPLKAHRYFERCIREFKRLYDKGQHVYLGLVELPLDSNTHDLTELRKRIEKRCKRIRDDQIREHREVEAEYLTMVRGQLVYVLTSAYIITPNVRKEPRWQVRLPSFETAVKWLMKALKTPLEPPPWKEDFYYLSGKEIDLRFLWTTDDHFERCSTSEGWEPRDEVKFHEWKLIGEVGNTSVANEIISRYDEELKTAPKERLPEVIARIAEDVRRENEKTGRPDEED